MFVHVIYEGRLRSIIFSMHSQSFSSCFSGRLSPSTQVPRIFSRGVSSSPYGRTHVWKRRAPVLPNPIVPKFPQRVIRADGSSFTHWTTSPRSMIRLTRDTTNNPLWNTGTWADGRGFEEESATTGRLGRFNRKFEGIGGAGISVDFMESVGSLRSSALAGEFADASKELKAKDKSKKKK